jgi:hypothetical protein
MTAFGRTPQPRLMRGAQVHALTAAAGLRRRLFFVSEKERLSYRANTRAPKSRLSRARQGLKP